MDDKNKKETDNTVDDSSFEAYIKQKKKQSAKKRRIVIAAAAIVCIITAVVVTTIVLNENNNKKALEEVTADVSDLAERFDIDLICIKGNKDSSVIFASEKFAGLPANTMNDFFMALEDEKDYKVRLDHVEIQSQGFRFRVKDTHRGYRCINDYNGDKQIKPNPDDSEYKYTSSPKAFGSHIVAFNDREMTCTVIRSYRYTHTGTSSGASSDSNADSVPAGKRECSVCKGTGRVAVHFGVSLNQKEGYGYGDVCATCGGTGYVNK